MTEGPPGDASPAWHRHPADVAHLVVAALAVALLALLDAVEPGGIRRVARDSLDLVDRLPDAVETVLSGCLQALAVAVPLVVAVVLVSTRRWRFLGTLALAAVGGGVVMALVADVLGTSTRAGGDWLTGAVHGSGVYLAGLTAAATVASPSLTRPWRRAVGITVAVGVVLRVATAAIDPVTVALVVAVGYAAGAAVLVAFGAWRRPVDTDVVRAGLVRIGLDPAGVEPVGSTRGSSAVFSAGLSDGSRLRAAVIGRDDRDTDALLTAWRWLQVRGMGDPPPLARGSRLADRAVVTSSLADAAEVRVARPVGVAEVAGGAVLLAEPWLEGPGLDEVDADRLTPALLEDLWREVDRLHQRGIAHRQLRPERVRLTPTGPALVGFRTAEVDASERARDADVVQLLVATALRVGAERAVAPARAVLGDEALARVLPLLQPVVLQPATRSAAKGKGGPIDEVRAEVERATGAPAAELATVRRITLAGAVTLVGATVVGYYVLSLVSDAGSIWDALRQARWELLPWLLALMVAQYVAGALTLMGSVPERLALGRTTQVMFAQSFLNRFTPANAGGMALRTRYLQRSGISLGGAASAVGLTSAVYGLVQVVLLVGFLVAGQSVDAFDRISLPSGSRILVILVAIGVVVGLVLASAWGRTKVVPWLRETGREAWANVTALLREPGKLALLAGGASGSKVVTMAAFVVSARALGVSLSLASLGALFFVATTVGSAVPTPGGVGGVEAALTAALTSAGVDAATAASVVLLFRLVTFWIPVIPGWWFLQRVQKKQYV